MIDLNTKRMFKILDSRRNICSGPYWTAPEWRIHGKKPYWTEQELLDLPLSNTVKKRIPKLKPGTRLKLYSTGIYRWHNVVLMTEKEILLIEKLAKAKADYKSATQAFRKAAPTKYAEVQKAKKTLKTIQKKIDKAELK